MKRQLKFERCINDSVSSWTYPTDNTTAIRWDSTLTFAHEGLLQAIPTTTNLRSVVNKLPTQIKKCAIPSSVIDDAEKELKSEGANLVVTVGTVIASFACLGCIFLAF